ncbi:creatininase family protein [candidate division TA06 bacterium]|uniref:Creatininase family protein n=1 Tax=candidate division TA06 bacterium TaxID=2250710 RepID=A0A933I9R4_UNCT6|nr:creatininase family protein [candidate division TA06 bacterium]
MMIKIERTMARLNWKQFKKLVPGKINRALLPVGTIEAHGPGALGTDAIIPEYICQKLAGPLNALVAPTIPYGLTRSLIGFPGSLTVSPETLTAYLKETALSLANAGFKYIIIMNGHGGNNDCLKPVGPYLWQQQRARTLTIHWWEASSQAGKKYFKGTGHAGADELAALMAVDPGLVSKEDYQKQEVGDYPPGMSPYPFHAAMILNQRGLGYPVFDAPKARKYMGEVIKIISDEARTILNAWEKLD